jgi:hypothetical protein
VTDTYNRQRVDQRVQHRSAATRPHLADPSRPLQPSQAAQRPSATAPPLATDQKVGGSSPSERANEATGQGLATGNGRGPESLSGDLISHNFSQL